MKNGYEILWTDNALIELQKTIIYLEENWTEKELQNLVTQLEHTLKLIAQNPHIFQVSDFKKEVRRAVVLTLNTLYYRILEDKVEILSFFSNRQNPKKRKLK
ncbi:type II toxin-antitoxin system RelE/ParE family toxin [Flavobacterium antarcticum]|uniref:type II toxin-antitoxin system RelE/ParE family toxin n=1 Tax=Flavobacterium antarcticum TaxID=271155 RepID=UPI0003B37E7D|nr:type II toxin-antitoxin system RelE/ParE family toxin [Flavobacterium antarcticum]